MIAVLDRAGLRDVAETFLLNLLDRTEAQQKIIDEQAKEISAFRDQILATKTGNRGGSVKWVVGAVVSGLVAAARLFENFRSGGLPPTH